jgi:hypothetical protein
MTSSFSLSFTLTQVCVLSLAMWSVEAPSTLYRKSSSHACRYAKDPEEGETEKQERRMHKGEEEEEVAVPCGALEWVQVQKMKKNHSRGPWSGCKYSKWQKKKEARDISDEDRSGLALSIDKLR